MPARLCARGGNHEDDSQTLSGVRRARRATAGVYKGDYATIDFPDGWSTPEADADGLIITRQSENGANCNLQVRKLPALASQPMAEINADYGHVFDLDDWADCFGTPADKLTVIASDIRPLETPFSTSRP